MKVVSLYTDFYKEPANLLREDLDKHGMDHDICRVKDRGSWRNNVRYKPEFILKKLEELDEDIIFLDADTRVDGPLEFPEHCDLAIRYSSIPSKNDPNPKNKEPLCGAMFLRNNGAVRMFLAEWVKQIEKADPTLRRPEQQVLRAMLPKSKLRIHKLPPQYGKRFEEDVPDPVILHGRWTDIAGEPPVSEEVIARKEERREERRKNRGDVDQIRKVLVARKKQNIREWHPNKFKIRAPYAAALSITFDDGRSTQFDVGMKVLDEFDVKGTFYICPNIIQKQRSGWKRPAGRVIEVASWPEVIAASDNGHEIGNHTNDHVDIHKVYDSMEPDDRARWIKQQICGASSAIAHRTNQAHFSFAWPYHHEEARCNKMIHSCHTGIRQFQPRGIYNMKAATKVWKRRMSEWVDQLIAEKKWGQAAIHDVGAGHDPIPEDILRWHIEDVLERYEIKIVTVNEMYEACLPPPPPPRQSRRAVFMKKHKEAEVKKQKKKKQQMEAEKTHKHFRRRRK